MSLLGLPCPQPPDFRVDWEGLDASFEWISSMRGCPQDPIFHAEGDVWIHTRMVCDALVSHPGWKEMPPDDREVVFAAALLHDVSKPACRRQEDDRITSRGHSGRGEVRARRILWRLGADLRAREEVARIVGVHQVPFFVMERGEPAKAVHRISQFAAPHKVAMVAEADARGRVCEDQSRILENVELFRELAREQDCYRTPRRFASDHSRFWYFRTEGRDPDYHAHDDTRCQVTLLCGLPGAGKDTWVAANATGSPVISLDALRQQMGVSASGRQGAVVAAAKEQARRHLRTGTSFIWNATNLSRRLRGQLVELFADYRARVVIHYLEPTAEEQRGRNEVRDARVPDGALERMLERWQVPDLTEAHEVWWNGDKLVAGELFGACSCQTTEIC